jgi:hypothetical protein
MRYMAAHGYAPGPTQRPLLTGAVTGAVSAMSALPLLCRSGAWERLSIALGSERILTLVVYVLTMAAAGLLYGRLFMRAANDVRGGWLFGISYGFLLWVLGPVTILQWIRGEPVATGHAAMGLLGTQLLFGLILGTVFPWVHRLFQPKLGSRLERRRHESSASEERAAPEKAAPRKMPA